VALGVLIIGITLVGFFIWKKIRIGQRGTVDGELGDTERDHSTNPKSGYPLIPVRPESEHEVQGDSRSPLMPVQQHQSMDVQLELEVPAIAPSQMDGIGANTK
jgi:hypothetical protein